MKVYFCGSIRGGRDDVQLYQRIVRKLQTYGTVLTEHVSSSELSDRGEDASAAGDKFIHDRDVDWLQQSDGIKNCGSSPGETAEHMYRSLYRHMCGQALGPSPLGEVVLGRIYVDSDSVNGTVPPYMGQSSSSYHQYEVVVAEVTQPSLGVGYELGRAVDMKKKIFCLFRPSSGRTLSAMIRGADDGNLFVVRDYREDEMENILEEFFNKLKK